MVAFEINVLVAFSFVNHENIIFIDEVEGPGG